MYKKEIYELSREQLIDLLQAIDEKLDHLTFVVDQESIRRQSQGFFDNFFGAIDSMPPYSIIFGIKNVLDDHIKQAYNQERADQDCIQ